MKNLLACAASIVFAATACAEAEYPDVSVAEVKEAIAAKTITILDVNGSTSFANGHVPSALDFEVVSADLAKSLPEDKDTLIVAYCGGPTCGAYKAAAAAAKELGYTNVKHMSAGLSGWLQAGEPTEKQEITGE